VATAGSFCRRNAWTKRYLRWRSLVQPWESCITRPGNINAGDDDNSNHLRFRLRLEHAGSELLLPGWCFLLQDRRWQAVGQTVHRGNKDCAQSFCFDGPDVPCTPWRYPAPHRVEEHGPRPMRGSEVGLEGSATSLLRVRHGLLAIVDLRIRNTCACPT
jgi:hypothetical protein